MGMAISGVNMVENQTDSTIEIKQVLVPEIPGHYAHAIQIPPRKTKEVGATEFKARSSYAGRTSLLVVFVDGRDIGSHSLTPSKFVGFSKIILRLDGPQFVISGIRPQWTDLGRIRCFGFMGRNYPERIEETISITMISGDW